MPVTSNNKVTKFERDSRFIVHTMDGKDFVLNGSQTEVLKKASMQGTVGLVWFGDFAINMSRIESVEKKGSMKSNNGFDKYLNIPDAR